MLHSLLRESLGIFLLIVLREKSGEDTHVIYSLT